METSSTAAILTHTAATVKTPEAETEAPPRIHQPSSSNNNNGKPLSFTNGVLKRHLPIIHHHHHLSTSPPPVVITYKECLKNHAASLGTHAVDGCGEFMPSPASNPTDPTSLKCAACGCHRNFHRREPDEAPPPSGSSGQQVIEYQPLHRHHPPPPPPPLPRNGHSSPNSASPPPISSSYYPSAPHMLLALRTGVAGQPPDNSPGNLGNSGGGVNSSGRKRFRTKFTQEQKAKMHEIAERIGWKMQKRDEDLISEFCNEIGIEKVVFKVWMHNNKNTLGKRDSSGAATVVITNNGNSGNGSAGGSRSSPEETTTTHFHLHHHHRDVNNSDHHHNNHHLLHHQNGHNNNNGSSAHVAATTNGSSSSS